MKFFNKMFFSIIICFLFSVSFIHAQLETNGSFENSKIGVVAGSDIKGWLIQTVSGITPAPVFEIV
jgi:hypothetical protein